MAISVLLPITAVRSTQKFYLQQLFGELVADKRTPTAYSDFSPKTLAGWEKDVRVGVIVPYCWFVGDELGGAFWMHDFADDYTWLGGYVMSAFRGPETADARTLGWQACERALREDGLQRLFSVVLAHNTAAQIWTATCCGFTPLGVYQDWTLNRGQWTDGVVVLQELPGGSTPSLDAGGAMGGAPATSRQIDGGLRQRVLGWDDPLVSKLTPSGHERIVLAS